MVHLYSVYLATCQAPVACQLPVWPMDQPFALTFGFQLHPFGYVQYMIEWQQLSQIAVIILGMSQPSLDMVSSNAASYWPSSINQNDSEDHSGLGIASEIRYNKVNCLSLAGSIPIMITWVCQ